MSNAKILQARVPVEDYLYNTVLGRYLWTFDGERLKYRKRLSDLICKGGEIPLKRSSLPLDLSCGNLSWLCIRFRL